MGARLLLGVALSLVVAGAATRGARADKGPYRLAVMEFAGAGTSKDPDSLGKGLQSMITTDLAQVAVFQLVERARLRDIQGELALQQSSQVDKDTAAKIGKASGATHLLVGSLTAVGGKTISIEVRFVTVASGAVVMVDRSVGETARLFDLEKALVNKLVEAAGVKISKKEKADVLRPHTSDVEAFRQFSQGLAQLDSKQYPAAEASLKLAVGRDQGFALAASTLAEVQRLMASLPSVSPPGKEPTAPVKAPQSCRPNPVFTACLPDEVAPMSATPTPSLPSTPTTPTPGGGSGGLTEGGGTVGGGVGVAESPQPVIFSGDGNRHFTVTARGDFGEARCVTPCQMHLRPGKVQMSVTGPVQYTRDLLITSEPTSVVVSGTRMSYLGVGGALAGAAVALTVVGLTFQFYTTRYSTGDPMYRGSASAPFAGFAPYTIALGISLAGPALMYLLQAGSNSAKVLRHEGGGKVARRGGRLQLGGVAIAPTATGAQAAMSFSF